MGTASEVDGYHTMHLELRCKGLSQLDELGLIEDVTNHIDKNQGDQGY